MLIAIDRPSPISVTAGAATFRTVASTIRRRASPYRRGCLLPGNKDYRRDALVFAKDQFVVANGQTVATSGESFASKGNAKRAIEEFKKQVERASVPPSEPDDGPTS
jgi:uncharacterized protein YegP (UPF0339 family)